MATYFHGSTEIQGNSNCEPSTLIFMNPAAENIRQSVVLSCKYLEAAKELLDEVVNVGKERKNIIQSHNGPKKEIGESSAAAAGVGEINGGDGVAKSEGELATSEKLQEIQMKKAKLVNMLDEAEQRYKEYKQHVQMATSWFEQIAGIGSSKTYTALAQQTISKQFRNLKDAILAQIQVASNNLGKEDSSIEGSRIYEQRALQQLGMIKHDAWRPQRGLPERSVSVLRTWLFQHFFHPYPKDSDKVMLAKQTGLTRSQVSNWFINARVRLWKPMVEEMYTEEMKERSEDGKTEHNDVVPASKSLSRTSEIMAQGSPKKPCNAVNLEIEKQDRDGNFIGGFGSYPIMEFGAPYSGNGVSLTLGLPHAGPHQSFLPNYFSGMNTSSSKLFEGRLFDLTNEFDS